MVDNFLIGAAVGSGAVARAAEYGGADFLIALSAGRMRNMGVPSISCMLPLADSQDQTLSFAESEVLPQSKLPVYLGINTWSAQSNNQEIANKLRSKGFFGAVNFPSIIHLPFSMQRLLERSGQGIKAEIDLLSVVHDHGKQALFYCATQEQAVRAAEAGLGGIVFNFGWNIGGAIGHKSDITLEETVLVARDVTRRVRSIKPDIKIFLEGGPILAASDLNYIVQSAPIDGYVGGSTIDRFPIMNSVANQIAEYKHASIGTHKKSSDASDALKAINQIGIAGQSAALSKFSLSLIKAAHNKSHTVITHELGCDVNLAVDLLVKFGNHQQEGSALYFDFAVERPSHKINELIFGRNIIHQYGNNRLIQGLLNEGQPSFVIFKSAHLMPKLVAKKLATTMRDGRYHSVGQRNAQVLKSRFIFVSELSQKNSLSMLDIDVSLNKLNFPSLRKRHDDIPEILANMLEELGLGVNNLDIRPAAYRALAARRWKKNEAELRQFAMQISQQAINSPIESYDIQRILDNKQHNLKVKRIDDAIRTRVVEALVQNGFRKGETARYLHVSRKTLYNWMKKLKLN